MFDWLGFKNGLPLWWSYRLNRELKADVEDIFEGIAHTRKELLTSWTVEYWSHLERLLEQMELIDEERTKSVEQYALSMDKLFAAARSRAMDLSEIFCWMSKQLSYFHHTRHIQVSDMVLEA